MQYVWLVISIIVRITAYQCELWRLNARSGAFLNYCIYYSLPCGPPSVAPQTSAHPRFTSTSPILTGLYCALSTASPLLTRLAWGVVIPGCATVESVNSRREGFRGARTGSTGPWWAPSIKIGSQTHYPCIIYQCYYRGGVGILPCNALLILLLTFLFFIIGIPIYSHAPLLLGAGFGTPHLPKVPPPIHI
jgi:hypothetical protein